MHSKELDALLTRVSKGDNVAFGELYEKTRRGVYAFLYTYFHNAADTEDAMQSVYLRVKRGIGSYRQGSNGRAWLLQIAKNLAYNELKKRSREIPTDEIEIRSENYEGSASVREIMEKVLTEEEQRIVALHVFWEYKHREIAEIMGCPTGTVTSKYKRSVEKLKKYLKEETL